MSKKKSEYKIVAERRGSGNPIIKSKLLIAGISAAAVGTAGLIAGAIVFSLPKNPIMVETFKVSFDANGGTITGTNYVSLSSVTKFKDLNAPTVSAPSGSGQVFNCWTLDKEGHNTIDPNKEFKENVTLYATYKTPSVKRTLTFSNNKEAGVTISGISSVEIEDGGTFGSINKPIATKVIEAEKTEKKYNFQYWTTNPTKPEEGKIDNTAIINDNKTIYPVFEMVGIKFNTLTFQPLDSDKIDGIDIVINGVNGKDESTKQDRTISINSLLPWSQCNKPSVSKTQTIKGAKVEYKFEKWVRKNSEDVLVEVEDDYLCKNETNVIYPQFESVPVAMQNQYYLTDPDNPEWGRGIILDGSESIGDEIVLQYQFKADTVRIKKEEFNLPITIGQKITSISPNFLAGCTSFNQEIVIPSNIDFIGNNFLAGCKNFNNGYTGTKNETAKPLIIPSTVKTIGDSFLYNCSTFNQSIKFNEGLTKINNYFMYGCETFTQDLEFPKSLAYIGSLFMYESFKFNGKITFPKGSQLAYLGSGFLNYCTSFTQDLDLSNTQLTSIEDEFMKHAKKYSGKVTLPSTVETIGNWFMSWINDTSAKYTIELSNLTNLKEIGYYAFYVTQFSCDMDFSECTSLTKIGMGFIAHNSAFNGKVTLPTNNSGFTEIPDEFMSYDTSFNQLITIPNTITKIGSDFLAGCESFKQSLSIPSGVTKIGSGFLYGCTNFNSEITIPSGVTSISDWFLGYCSSFNQKLDIPDTVTTIGNYFLYKCEKFNNAITIHDKITSVGFSFMSFCKAMDATITINIEISNFAKRNDGYVDSFYRWYDGEKYMNFNVNYKYHDSSKDEIKSRFGYPCTYK